MTNLATHDITSNKFTSKDLLLLTITLDNSLHSNVTLQTSDNVGSLLFLVPTDDSVEHKNTDNNTEINPVTKTSSKENSQFHN